MMIDESFGRAPPGPPGARGPLALRTDVSILERPERAEGKFVFV